MNLFVAGLPYDVDDAELEEIFEKFKNEKKYLIIINDKRVENSELEKMNRTDIYYFSEMENPPTSTREHFYFLYTK